MNHVDKAVEALRTALGTAIASVDVFRGETTVELGRESLLAAVRRLHDDAELDFNFLAALTATDRWPEEPRFSVVYQLYSFKHNVFLGLRARLPGDSAEIDSLEPVFPAANWHEREVFDLFGITFRGHSDLRRILLPYDWVGHPLRKDQPQGYEEVQFTFNYDEIDRRKPYARE
ncbi:MAG TPA: NADH-quinone oxidoreductase subunit C [Anaerolineales bacterium]|nr:NADH-quinone oxidoreductase subunit C [Anaerolineales bacterium]